MFYLIIILLWVSWLAGIWSISGLIIGTLLFTIISWLFSEALKGDKNE